MRRIPARTGAPSVVALAIAIAACGRAPVAPSTTTTTVTWAGQPTSSSTSTSTPTPTSTSTPTSIATSPPPAASAPSPPAIRKIGKCEKPGGTQRFTLAHFNDLQARYSEQLAGKSRYAYLAGYLRALKQEQPNTLVLDAGDDYEKGSLADLRSNGEVTRQMIQALPIDARTIGNHDFAYGEGAVMRDVLSSAHPVLAANIRRGEDEGPFVPYVRFDVGCVKVGVIGLTTNGYGADDNQTAEPYLGVFHHDPNYFRQMEVQIRKHRAEVDVMIALTHIGVYFDTDLAKAHSGIDVFVGAHSEDLLGDLEGARRKEKMHAYVLQVGHYARHVGRAEIVVGPNHWVAFEKYNVVPIDEKMPVAADVAELAARLEREAVPDIHATIGNVQNAIDPQRGMVDLVHRAAIDRWGIEAFVLGTDIFFDGLPAGPITLQRLYDSVYVQKEPAGTTGFTSLYLVNVSGEDLKAMKSRVRAPWLVYVPDNIQPTKTYKLAIEKRAMMFPAPVFPPPPKSFPPSSGNARFAGEIIDVLEAYARARTAKGLAL